MATIGRLACIATLLAAASGCLRCRSRPVSLAGDGVDGHVNAFVSNRPDSIWGWAPGEAPVAPVLAPKPAPPRAEAVTEQGSVVSEGVAVGYFGVYRVKDPANVVTLPPVLIMDGEGDAQRVDAILTKYNVRHETDIYPDAPDRHLVDDHVVHFLSRYLPAN